MRSVRAGASTSNSQDANLQVRVPLVSWRLETLRTLVVGFIVVLALAHAGCRANMGVGVSIPIGGGGWRGAYGGLSMGVGIPIR